MAVMLGLPWLAGVLLSGFAGVVSFLATFIAKRIAIIIAVIAAFVVLVGIALTALHAGMDAIVALDLGGLAIGLIVPANLAPILASWFSIKVVLWLYQWNMKLAQLRIL